ncbi:MAG: NAD(P)-dependent oxidoreductase [Pirellulales bacterium]|nr:NAD(P)-dependent oxidoreductase [Pirellulales bacterium]
MKVLITGGAGYIGSVLTEHLLARGDQVHTIDNLTWGEHCLFQFCANPNFQFTKGDVRDPELLASAVKDADVIIPLAALVGAPLCKRDPQLAKEINLDAVLELDKLRSASQLMIYPNTNSGYGIGSGDSFCTEESPLEPISVYGRTKCDAELALLDKENAITFRLATVFGASPRMRIDLLVNHFTYSAVTDGYLVVFEKDFKRNYVHIRDVADCMIYAMENREDMVGRPFNLGLDEANLSKEQLCEKIQKFVPSFFVHYAEIGEDPDKRDYIVSNERLKQVGFVARRSLDDGIQELIKAYRTLGLGKYRNA